MNWFAGTPSGRMLLLTAGLVLTGGGVGVLLGGPTATVIMAIVYPVALTVGVFAMVLAPAESFAAALAGVLGLPFPLLAFATLLGVMVKYYPDGGYALLVLGAITLVLILLPPRGMTDGDDASIGP
jgi:hypothetical protein